MALLGATTTEENTMTMMTMLRDEQKKHKAGSDLQKLLCWAELHIADQFDRIVELEDEIALLQKDNERRCHALNQVRGLLVATGDYILSENFDLPVDTFARDFAPFKNAMAAHGVEPYANPKRRKKSDV